ncbi:DUF3459 domain-containing protein [Nocardiopsis xinjiangensis]|uniref:DUF3459 domain-containing protein n=1 Tax=Nocardiopsis xinjiangensis TaxID=124285 RepID=UPI00034A9ABC
MNWDPDLNRGQLLAFWRGGYVLVLVNTGTDPVPLPEGEIMVASEALPGGELPGEAAVWLHREP